MARYRAIKVLASMPPDDALPLLTELARDKEPSIAFEAVKAISGSQPSRALSLWFDFAKQYPNFVREAVRSIAACPKVDALPLLRELALRGYANVRAEAIEAMVAVDPREALSHLRSLAKDKNPEARRRVAWLAVKFPLKDALSLLQALAQDEDDRVKRAAKEAMASMEESENLPLVKTLALSPEEDISVRAIRTLAKHFTRKELETFLNENAQTLSERALAALDEILYLPEWLRGQRRPGEMY